MLFWDGRAVIGFGFQDFGLYGKVKGRYPMRLFYAVLSLVFLNVGIAHAGEVDDCNQSSDPDLQVKGCSSLISGGSLSPTDASIAHNNRAYAYTKKGRHDVAIADLNRAIRLNPKFGKSYTNRGIAHQRRGRYDRAIADYNAALRINPKDALALSNRGNAFRKKSQYTRAVQDYTQAIQLNPRLAEAYTNRGDAYKDAKLYDLALVDYNRAVRLDQRSSRAYAARGIAFRGLGRYQDSIRDLSRAIRLQPNFAAAYNARGNAHRRLCRYDKAFGDYEQSIKIGNAKRVKFYQVFLKKRGHYKGVIDGQYSRQTKTALNAFVRGHKCGEKQPRLYRSQARKRRLVGQEPVYRQASHVRDMSHELLTEPPPTYRQSNSRTAVSTGVVQAPASIPENRAAVPAPRTRPVSLVTVPRPQARPGSRQIVPKPPLRPLNRVIVPKPQFAPGRRIGKSSAAPRRLITGATRTYSASFNQIY